MYTVKGTNPNVPFAVGYGTVRDAEGSVIPNSDLSVRVESDNTSAVAVSFTDPSGTLSFGTPKENGDPNPANVKFDLVDNRTGGIILTKIESFVVVAGDAAAVENFAVVFDGLTPDEVDPGPADEQPVDEGNAPQDTSDPSDTTEGEVSETDTSEVDSDATTEELPSTEPVTESTGGSDAPAGDTNNGGDSRD